MDNTNRAAELEARIMAQLAARKAAHVHAHSADMGNGKVIEVCICGARRVAATAKSRAGEWSASRYF